MTPDNRPQTPRGGPDSTEDTAAQADIEKDVPFDAEDDGDNAADSLSAVDELQAALDQARAEAEQYRDQAVRAAAEIDNVRKRAQRDVESARKFAIEKFALGLLEVRDGLELGLQAAAQGSGDFDRLKEGMQMTNRMLASSMEKAGTEVIDPQGETFNPDYHEAVSTQPTTEHKPNTVASVMQKGYMLNGRVLRPVRVAVTRAPEEE
ncbi:MAG: nucleotide exchange factor GrpE [Salinisphaera sp.]|jgi:molecular chaperone GrpE|nr:nucleotide exchange factor GrpE [Salinisphaera sp.]